LLPRWKGALLEKAPTVFQGDERHDEEQAGVVELERMVGRLSLELEVAKKPPAC